MRIDIETIKCILEKKPAIHFGDFIPCEVTQLLRFIPHNQAMALFEKSTLSPTSENRKIEIFECEFICNCCGKLVVENLSKTKILAKDELVCQHCAAEVKKQRENERQQDFIKYSKLLDMRREVNTEYFINYLLDPNYEFDKDLTLSQKWSLVNDDIESSVVAEYIKKMNYHEFLNTPYWKVVRDKKLQKADYTCQVCGRKNVPMNIHHTTYSIRGYEHKNLDKLTCLCADCHNKYHMG